MKLESHKERFNNLKNYMNKYQHTAVKMYKHELKVSAMTVGGSKHYNADMGIQAICDAKLQVCKISTKIEKSPIDNNKDGQWVLDSKLNLVTPEVSNSVEELEEQTQKHKKFIALVETSWGQQNSKQNIKLRIQVFIFFKNIF